MRFTKILAGLLLVLALGLAVMAWVLSKETPRDVKPAAAASTSEVLPRAEKTPASALVQVLVAAHVIAAGQRITEADIQVVEKSSAPEGAFNQLEKLVGQTTLVAVQPQEIFLEQHLVAGLSLQLESGQRAIAIAVKEAMAAGNHIRPGDFVDVFFTLQEDGKEIKVDTQTRLLLARARVLAYGSRTVENPPETQAQRKLEQAKDSSQRTVANKEEVRGRAEVANTALLAVPLEDVQRLTLAEKYGQLNLALRHPDDIAVPDAALFAALPVALRPAGLHPTRSSELAAIDRAFAGLRFSDLAEGGAKSKSSTAASSRRAAKMTNSRAGGGTSTQTIELLNGSHVQSVSY